MRDDIQNLFSDFDAQADAVIDMVIVEDSPEEAAMLASGLAIRLVQWCIPTISDAEAKVIAASLVTELTTLAANIKRGPDQ
jgi:hypothetical protein